MCIEIVFVRPFINQDNMPSHVNEHSKLLNIDFLF